jgi:hypothetical protein
MRHRYDETGATLLMIVGAVAALAVLSAALVALTVSVMGNTSRSTQQVKAFNVAEAGLDTGQKLLWQTWPGADGTVPTPTLDTDEFRDLFPTSEFPDPKTGDFVDVQFYDDDGAPLPNPGIDRAVDRDANGNGIMWIEAAGATGKRAAKVMACVQRVQYDLRIRENVAVFTNGELEVKGTGNQPVVGLDPPATAANVYAGGDIDMNGQSDVESGITTEEYTSVTLQSVFPAEILQNIIQAGKVFANWGAYTAWKTAHPGVEPFATDPRIIIIEDGDVDAKGIPDTDTRADGLDTVWSEEEPGILVVLDGDFNATGQKKTIYGIVYVVQGLVLGGNAEIHGMVVAEAWANMHGTRAVNYNQNVIANLNKPVTLSVKLVPNTWRELSANAD